MKLSYEEKVEIYNEWKLRHKSPERIGKERNLDSRAVKYMVHLADRHELSVLEHKWTYYSPEFKEAAIKRVLIGGESANEVSLDLRLSNHGTLPRWIKEYRENGYTVIERKKGRHAREGKDNRGTSGRKRSTESTERRASAEESRVNDQIRIRKKIERLGFGKREIRKEEISEAVTELRQELKCSVEFILDTVNRDPELPHLKRSTYYYTIRKQDKDWKNDDLMNEIIQIFYEHRERYGYRRITLELRRRGIQVNHKAIQRLMKRMGLAGRRRNKRRYNSYKGEISQTAPDIIQRDFFADKPNEKVYADVSQFSWKDQKIYLHAMLDGYAGDIVSYDISFNPDLVQTMRMLDWAIQRYPDLEGAIFHTDQGWQYQHYAFRQFLEQHHMTQSMSRKGNCLDDALMENFFGLMKTEMFYGLENTYTTVEELIQAMHDYIRYFNNDRIKVRLKGLTPIEYRTRALLTV